MKMRAALSYGFGCSLSRGTQPWQLADNGDWRGNPSVSDMVTRFMVGLRKTKVCFWLQF
jgi:hypothetical protein